MFSQPRINDIASLYQGNPGALQQRIQQEQQAKPGLPPDLQKLLALQIITSEQDAMKRQQALQQLQQSGQQPTVAQSVEQRAKQALQARMLQEQQKQQGLQALAQQAPTGQIPEGVPQPERQPEPQGLDQLPSNIGEFAGGGIIAFDDGGDVSSEDKLTEEEKRDIMRRMRQRTDMRPEKMDVTDLDFTSVPGMERGDTYRKAMQAARGEEPKQEAPSEYGRQMGEVGKFLGEAGLNLLKRIVSYPGGAQEQKAPAAPQQAGVAGQVAPEDMAGFDRATAEYMARRGVLGAVPPERPAAPRAAAPAAPVAPKAPAGLAAAPVSSMPQDIRDSYNAALRASLGTDPEAQRQAEINRFKTDVGERPTASLETLAQELAAQRQKISERADPLRDLLRGIAMSPRGERWMFSGARGAEYADRAQAAREDQLLNLLKQQMEAQSKIEESKYGFKEKAFTIGNEAYKNAYESKRKALETAGMDAREADRLAKDYAQIASNEAIEASRRASAKEIAGMPARASATEERYIKEWLQKNPGKTYVDAYEAYKMSGVSGDRQTLAELKSLQASLRDQADMTKNINKESRDKAAQQLVLVNAKIAQMAGVDMAESEGPVSVTAGGKTYQFPSQAAADKFKAQAGIK